MIQIYEVFDKHDTDLKSYSKTWFRVTELFNKHDTEFKSYSINLIECLI